MGDFWNFFGSSQNRWTFTFNYIPCINKFHKWHILISWIWKYILCFYKIMPYFFRTNAMSIHKVQQFPWIYYFFFHKIIPILYPRTTNSNPPDPTVLFTDTLSFNLSSKPDKSGKKIAVKNFTKNIHHFILGLQNQSGHIWPWQTHKNLGSMFRHIAFEENQIYPCQQAQNAWNRRNYSAKCYRICPWCWIDS